MEPDPGPDPIRLDGILQELPRWALALTDTLLPQRIRDQLQNYDRVVIVPDGILHRLPFQALVVGKNDHGSLFVLDRLPPISYAPSLKAWWLLHQRDGQRQSEKKPLLSIGGGVYLEYAGQQVIAARVFRGLFKVLTLFGAKATESAFKAYAEQCAIILISAHAVYSDQMDGRSSCVYLAQDPKNDDQVDNGGRLEIHEILDLNLHGCRLVVLSTCDSAIESKRYMGAGNSLARAFLTAGATRVVASFWNVNDQATSQLMTSFYNKVAGKMKPREPVDYAAALHAAMIEIRNTPHNPNNGDWRSPYYLIGP